MRYLSFVIAICVLCSAFAAAQGEMVLYGGEDPATKGMTLGGWGSGYAVKSNEQLLNGSSSIKIVSQGFFAGGRIDFAQPLSLPTVSAKDSRYILFTMFFNETVPVNPAIGTIFAYDVDSYTMPTTSKLRFVFISADGRSTSVVVNTTAIDPDDGWMKVAVPLAKFKDLPNFNVNRMMVFSDQSRATFFIGEMKLVDDKDPIKIEPLDSQVIAVMDEIFFTAKATAGVSNLKYSWDFDISDGISTDSADKISRKFYAKGGKYTVTLTVSDADGIKSPATVKTEIEVND